MKILLVVVLFLILFVHFAESIECDGTPKNTDMRLRQKLFCSYDKDIRPTTANTTIIRIRSHILSFRYSEFDGTITVNSWINMVWKDEHLTWNKDEFDGISNLVIHSDDIWKPDLTTYHSESTQYHESCSPSHCNLKSDGSVRCIPPCSNSGNCEGNYKKWPYDVERCTLRMGTWMHKGEEVRFIAGNVTMQRKVVKHNEWRITYVEAKNEKGNYSCCPNETYPSIRYIIYMERHSASEATFIFAPALILAILCLVSLWLNPNCSERILLNVISMFSHFLYLQQLSWLVPKNGAEAPDVLIYFRDSMVIATVLLVDTIIKRGLLSCRSPMPAWVKSTTDSLRGNRVGQLMFTNPYLINKVPLNNESQPGEDIANLVEAQPTEETVTNPKVEEKNVWYITVRVLDTLMFVLLVITYFVLMVGWVHVGYMSSHQRHSEEIKSELPDDDDDD